MDLKDVIGIIPDLLLFIIPGYITIRVHEKYDLQKRIDDFDTILYSILYSFVIGILFSIISKAVCRLFPSCTFFFEESVVKQILYLLLALMMSLLLIKLPKTRAGELVRGIFNKNLAPYSSVWIKAMQNDAGVWATVYLKNGLIYSGKLINYTSDPNESIRELLLTNYRLALQNNGPITSAEDFCCEIEDHTHDSTSKVLLDRSDILAIEINN